MKYMAKYIKKIIQLTGYTPVRLEKLRQLNSYSKFIHEAEHWNRSFDDYQKWYNAEIDNLYGEMPPIQEVKIKEFSPVINAILTWQKIHQQPKYLMNLQLNKQAFNGLTILDIGSGPHPSALVFENCKVFCLEPLIPEYLKIGFPIHIYEDRLRFVYGFSENMPFTDNFFDAVISVNAIDHVDIFEITVQEIKRVLKPKGKVRLHIHYHKKTETEPLELNDMMLEDSFLWCSGFTKINESKHSKNCQLTDENEKYVLWSNF